MEIALIGGTGDLGAGLALRWGTTGDHDIVIGSRDADRAEARASEYREKLSQRGYTGPIEGTANAEAALDAGLIVLSVPPLHLRSTVRGLRSSFAPDAVLVSPVVGMKQSSSGFRYDPPAEGSFAELVREEVPDGPSVVCACTALPGPRLADLDDSLSAHTVVVGDDAEAKERVSRVINDIPGLRSLDAGPLSNARDVEAMTPVLINVGRYTDDFPHPGLRFV